MKNELLKDLYDSFYIPPEFSEQRLEIKECHQTLIEAMDKQERRLMLQIIDAKDYMIENISIDSFFSGFELAWKLSAELNNYENEHPISCRRARELGARFLFKKEEEKRGSTLWRPRLPLVWPCVPLCGRKAMRWRKYQNQRKQPQ